MNPINVLKERCEYARSFQDNKVVLPLVVAEQLEGFIRDLIASKASVLPNIVWRFANIADEYQSEDYN